MNKRDDKTTHSHTPALRGADETTSGTVEPSPEEPRTEGAGDAEGRIAAVFADRCLVWCAAQDGHQSEEIVCSLRGRFKGHIKPVVGDNVRIQRNEEGFGTVVEIAERTSELRRAVADRKRAHKPSAPQVLAANVDLLVAVASLNSPPLRGGLLERFLVAAALAKVASAICLTKLDLDDEQRFESARAPYVALGIPVVGTRVDDPASLEALAALLRGRTSVLVGHSGVGKTSLLNVLIGGDMATREVGFHKDRGRHTTSTARMIPLIGGGFAIDSPGVREFGLHGITRADLAHLYPDFGPYVDACGFRDCLHKGEPRCAVQAAVDGGAIQRERHAHYVKLLEELPAR